MNKPLSIYTGTREHNGTCRVVVTTDGREYKLNARHDLCKFSTHGLDWGYTGVAPLQLALAMLADCCGENVAIANYQHFRRDMISGMPARGWSLTSDQIEDWVRQRGRSVATVDETDAHDCEGR